MKRHIIGFLGVALISSMLIKTTVLAGENTNISSDNKVMLEEKEIASDTPKSANNVRIQEKNNEVVLDNNKDTKIEIECNKLDENRVALVSSTQNVSTNISNNQVINNYATKLKDANWLKSNLQYYSQKGNASFALWDINQDGVNELILRESDKDDMESSRTYYILSNNGEKLNKVGKFNGGIEGYSLNSKTLYFLNVNSGTEEHQGYQYSNGECNSSTSCRRSLSSARYQVNNQFVDQSTYEKYINNMKLTSSENDIAFYEINNENIKKYLQVQEDGTTEDKNKTELGDRENASSSNTWDRNNVILNLSAIIISVIAVGNKRIKF